MARDTHRLQAVIDLASSEHVDEVLSRMAPFGHKHINLRGILKFDFAQHASGLLRRECAGELLRSHGKVLVLADPRPHLLAKPGVLQLNQHGGQSTTRRALSQAQYGAEGPFA